MHLIVGHTTHDSSWIWIRGQKDVRCAEVEIRPARCPRCGGKDLVKQASRSTFFQESFLVRLACAEDGCGATDVERKMKLRLKPASDFTAVARFDHVLQPNTEYRVFLRSKKIDCEVEGRFCTFAEPRTKAPFEFFHGSCNLPVTRLTALGGVAAGVAGGVAARSALRRSSSEWHGESLQPGWRFLTWTPFRYLLHGWLRAAGKLVGGFTIVVNRLTRYEQSVSDEGSNGTATPRLPSPFTRLVNELDQFDDRRKRDDEVAASASRRPAFMIHAGDQIYVDVDFRFPWKWPDCQQHDSGAAPRYERPPSQANYRRNYRQAWFEDPTMAKFLAQLPHYMILDDHEIIDGFGNDARRDEHRYLEPALNAYDEYVSSRQPQMPPADLSKPHARHKGYSFEYGDVGFFVLDTRTKRSVHKGFFIQKEQEDELLKWLAGESPHRQYALRFVVSSVPFVAQRRPPGEDDRDPYGQRDKWSGEPWRGQRARILRAIHESPSGGLVFLVGDMHCAYHATMRIGTAAERTTIHELAGGPINQLQFARRADFYAQFHGECDPKEEHPDAPQPRTKLPWTSTMQAFHGAAASVLRVKVDPRPPEVAWEVIRLSATRDESSKPRSLAGLIRFPRPVQRHPR